MSTKFRRRLGAAADVHELEFVSALHQTCIPYLRENGTVSSLDVVRFLKSREGLIVSKQDGIRIVNGLGGGLVGEEVIEKVLELSGNEKLEMLQKQQETRNVMDKIRLASSLGALRKKLLHQQKQSDEKAEEVAESSTSLDAAAGVVDTSVKEQAEASENLSSAEDVENPTAATDETQDCEVYLDLVQITAILLMPTLARAGQEWHNAQGPPPPPEPTPPPRTYEGMKGRVLKIYDSYKTRKREEKEAFQDSLKPKPETLISDALATLLSAVDCSPNEPPVLNAELVRKLLTLYGECERAADETLVEKMVQAATTSSGAFDEYSLVQALTSDLTEWNVGAEDSDTSSFHDVWGYSSYYEKAVMELKKEEAATKEVDHRDVEDVAAEVQDVASDVQDVASDVQDVASEVANEVHHEDASESNHSALANAEDALESIVKGVGTEGVGLAKQAATGGASIVKAAQKGGALEVKAERKHLKETPAVELIKRINPLGTEIDAHKVERHKAVAEDGEETDYKVNRVRTIFAIDSATDMYSSSLMTVGIFVFFICTSLVYASLFQSMPVLQPQCGDKFGCLLLDKIITWAIFAVFLSLTGYFVILPLSTGNNPVERSPVVNFVAFAIALVFTWMPYAAVEVYKTNKVDAPYDKPEKAVRRGDYYGSQITTAVVGCIVAGLIFIQLAVTVAGNRYIRQSKWASRFLLTSTALGGGRTKRAATRKINRLLENASDMRPTTGEIKKHSALDVSGEVMINYVVRGETFEDCGGLYWTWKRLFSGYLLEEEGVWIMSRLLIIQTVQALFIAFKTYALTVFIEEAIRRCQAWQDDLVPGLPTWVYDFVPSPREARIALWPAFTVAFIVSLALFFTYLPSYVKRVIQFRCGMLPSLHTEHFALYRKSVDLVYLNIGNALYALVGASLLFFFLIGLIIMLFIWPATKDFMLLLLAWGLGLGITIGIKYVIAVFWRHRFYSGFYRTNPRKANLTQLALECWFIGLGGGVLVSRFCQFILAACFFVGRVDVPFLSADVSMFGYIFDYAPQSFVKDILVHEAHRHPYLERLLAMYMMKLKSDSFCSDAGACWRQLFVAALMPWMMKLRVFSDERLGDKLDEYNTRRKEGQSPLQLSQSASFNPEMRSGRSSQLVDDRSSHQLVDDTKEVEEDPQARRLSVCPELNISAGSKDPYTVEVALDDDKKLL